MKNRKRSTIGLPVADALGADGAWPAAGAAPVVAAAAPGTTVRDPNSRRPSASAVHSRGAAPGAPPPLAPPSQDNSAELNGVEPRPDTAPSGATADMTGAAADAGVLTTAVVAVTAACAGLGEGDSAAAGITAADDAGRGSTNDPPVLPEEDRGVGVADGAGPDSLLRADVPDSPAAGAPLAGTSTVGTETDAMPRPRRGGTATDGSSPASEFASDPGALCTSAATSDPSDPAEASPARDPPRTGPGFDRVAVRGEESGAPTVLPSAELLDPAEPVVSAYATAGRAPTAAPTPNATARAPTLPT